MKILVIEDDKSLQCLLQRRLKGEGWQVDSCYDGQEGLEYAMQISYDCILLDLMIPILSGIEVLKALRNNGNTSFILILTAKETLEDRVAGLNAGADDYLIKPFFIDELVARIRALFRRTIDNKSSILKISDLEVDLLSHTVKRDSDEIDLTSKEFALLVYLMQNQGNVLSRTQISEHVWETEFYTESNLVDVYIRYLRNKVDKNYNQKLIHTIRGFGYVMRVNQLDS